jgi:hypothetical protein
MSSALQEAPRSFGDQLDMLEAAMAGHSPPVHQVFNHFAPGLYIREFHFPPGSKGVSMTHKFRHPFFIVRGAVRVISDNEGAVIYEAPFTGFTEPETRRALEVVGNETLVWITVHPNPDNETDADKIVARVTEPHENPAVLPHQGNQWRLNQTTALPE